MSLSLQVSFEDGRPPERFGAEGRALVGVIEALDELADELGVKPLTDFAAFGDVPLPESGGLDPKTITGETLFDPGGPARWHAPAEGLETIRALLAQLARDPSPVDDPAAIDALARLRDELELAGTRQTRFHVWLDS